jgi:hypothetical protein
VDCADVDCKSDSACDEVLLEICDNGVDDDGDGRTDCDDPLCRSAHRCHPGLEICNNNRDDDGDGRVDCADADCQTFAGCPDAAEDCDNGVDDSGDLNVDCADPKCASFTPCLLQSPWTKTYDTDGCTCRTGTGSKRTGSGAVLLGLLLGLLGLFGRVRHV